ncbi:MAG: hydroxyacid dehydrogenase [Deltaproteobacteria bacterium]|nr:hydroxyacid dehydrogenase [Deltaproteobacteria bacterium]
MARNTVLVTEPIHEDGLRALEQSGEVDVVLFEGSSSNISLEEIIKDSNAILVRVTEICRSMIEGSRALKIIAKHGVGYDNIDVTAATEKRIPVTFTPGTNAHSVAEHSIGFLLSLSKNLYFSHIALKNGKFTKREDFTGRELRGKRLGIIGLGRIGGELARKCLNAFDMKVIAVDPFITDEYAGNIGAELIDDLGDLLKMSDFVSIHTPLTALTKNLIGERELGLMKKTAFILNTARGGIINEQALYKALTKRWIAGAALDVFVHEPPAIDNPLLGLDNVIVTPHMGGITEEAMSRTAMMAVEDILRVLAGKRPENIINPEIYD